MLSSLLLLRNCLSCLLWHYIERNVIIFSSLRSCCRHCCSFLLFSKQENVFTECGMWLSCLSFAKTKRTKELQEERLIIYEEKSKILLEFENLFTTKEISSKLQSLREKISHKTAYFHLTRPTV
jgi:hypothetical protein